MSGYLKNQSYLGALTMDPSAHYDDRSRWPSTYHQIDHRPYQQYGSSRMEGYGLVGDADAADGRGSSGGFLGTGLGVPLWAPVGVGVLTTYLGVQKKNNLYTAAGVLLLVATFWAAGKGPEPI